VREFTFGMSRARLIKTTATLVLGTDISRLEMFADNCDQVYCYCPQEKIGKTREEMEKALGIYSKEDLIKLLLDMVDNGVGGRKCREVR